LSPLPADSFYLIRARSVLANSRYSSVGRYEIAWQFFGNIGAGPTGGAGTPGSGGGSSDDGSSGSDPGDGSSGAGGSSSGGGTGGSGSGTGSGTTASTAGDYHLVNLSVRAWPEDGRPFIAGFVINAAAPQRVLLRAVGPGLEAFGVSPSMTGPRLALFDSAGNLVGSTASWNGDQAVVQAAIDSGAFSLDPTSADAAMAVTLPPGPYSIHVGEGAGLNGVALAEVYFAPSAGEAGGLANVSGLAPVGAGSATSIIGFVVGGDTPRRFLVRGVGPALRQAPYNVAGAVEDTSVLLYNVKGELLARNDDWETQTSGTATEVAAAAEKAGAFALPAGGKDAALVVELQPGVYTMHVFGTAAGSALAEVYELP
jgi:hypothetical protein